MTSPSNHVAIVGAGPAGLTLAALLGHRGIDVTVIERKAALSDRSRAIALFPRSLEVLGASGALDGIVAAGEVNRHIRLRRARDHALLLDFPFDELDQVTATDFAVAIAQDRTERAMLDALGDFPNVTVRFGTEAVGYEDRGDDVVLTIRPGNGPEETLACAYLVGCDGAKSMVRAQLGWELKGKTYPTRAFLADIRVTEDADSADGWKVDTEAPGFVFCARFAPRTWRVINQSLTGDLPKEEHDAHARKLGHALFGEDGVEAVEWSSAYRKHERLADRYVAGRVILAGDAAHLNSPAGGQGMNTGLRDVMNLAWKLDLAINAPVDAERLLRSYEEEQRAAFLDAVGPFTDVVERVQTAPIWVRKLVFKSVWLGRLFDVEEKLARNLSMLFVNYGASEILAADGALVGRRMPDVMLPEGRLFSRIGRYGLILDRDGDSATRELGQRMGLPVARLPRALDELGFDGVESILVRPDHIVAAATGTALTERDVEAALALKPGERPTAQMSVAA